jgi:hypothetical protein
MVPKSIAAVAGAGIIALGAGAFLATQNETAPLSVVETVSSTTSCGDTNLPEDTRICGVRGFLLNGSLYNMQGAVQFCKWKAANPGEWTRLKSYLASTTPPLNIVTWLGAHIRDDIQAFLLANNNIGSTMPENNSPNICGGKILAPPTNLQTTTG